MGKDGTMETKKVITTEELFILFRDIKRLFPSTSIEDFSEIIEEDGYWDARQRTNIQMESYDELKRMWFGKGISQMKNLWHLFTTNQFYQVIDKDLINLSQKYKSQ